MSKYCEIGSRIADVSKSAAMFQAIQHGTIVVEPNGTQFKKDVTKLDLSGWRTTGRCGNCQHPPQSFPPFLFFTSFLFFSTEVPIEEEVLQLVEQKREDTRLQSDQQFVAVAVLG